MAANFKKSIGVRLLRYVFGFYFAIAVLVTSIQLVSEYQHVKDSIFNELANLGETLEASLAQSVWNYNTEQMQSILLGTEKVHLVTGVKITDLEGKIFALSDKLQNHDQETLTARALAQERKHGAIYQLDFHHKGESHTLFEYQFPIYFGEQQDDRQLIAQGHIYSNHHTIIERIQYGFTLIIINSLIKTLALWLIFLYFTKRIIAKPLGLLTQSAKQLNPNDPTVQDTDGDHLKEILAYKYDDEIHDLTKSFQSMKQSIIEKMHYIEQQNTTLEERVKERTATIEKVNKELTHLSLHDALTDLPNRTLFHDRLNTLLKMGERDHFSFALASIDLQRFKDINDNFGHQAGDEVLKTIAKRIQTVIRDTDTIARIGGDEFCVLLKGVDKDSVETVANKIMSCAYEPVIFNHESILAGFNVGFSFYPEHGNSSSTLYKKADIAMYQAKRSDNGVALFTQEVGHELQRRDLINRDLEKAIEQKHLKVFYQPIICSHSHKVKGIEALVRWQHPELGFIPPDEFVAVAERSQLIKSLTERVIKQSLIDGERLSEAGYRLSISINLSGRLVNDPTFPDFLAQLFTTSSLDKELITLELTESSMVNKPKQVMDTLHRLKALKVSLSIDDFGTGYSSFSYLTQFPVDELKIDRSFLLDFNENSRLVIESIIELAHRLKLKVVAEGVEDETMVALIEGLDGDYLQGYHFSRPIPIDELLQWLVEFK